MFAAGDKVFKGEQCATPVSHHHHHHYQPRKATWSGQIKLLLVLTLLLIISFISNEEYGGSLDVTRYNTTTSNAQDSGHPRPVAITTGGCNDVLGIRKVALLFLAKEPNIYHEFSWKHWFESAYNMLPAAKVHDAFCHGLDNNKTFSEIKDKCTTTTTTSSSTNRKHLKKPNKKNNNDPILQHHLFSAYVHIPLEDSASSFPPSSFFSHHVVSHRLPSTGWGGFSIVAATRSLLWEAYQDPHNQDFVLLSESDIPMYDPLTFYRQLTEETLSRINACPHHPDPGSMMLNRWTDAMETERMKKGNWRKSGQFWSLKREHVKMILEDEEVFGSFKRYCNGWVADGRMCVPDEHYFATLFSVMGKEEEANCASWGVVFADWSRGGAHPRAYTSSEATTATMEANRQSPDKCPAAKAQQCAKRMFIDISSLEGEELPDVCLRREEEEEEKGGCERPLLPVECHLTNRKWPEETADAVYDMFVNNTELGLLAHL